jgi:hypothetical protein
MNAYIFKKADRVVFNFVSNVLKASDKSISSNSETYVLTDEEDFIITNKTYNIGDCIDINENNKVIKLEEELIKEQINTLQGALDFIIMNY